MSSTRPGFTFVHPSEDHGERMVDEGLDMHLRLILLEDIESKIGSSLFY